MARHLVLFAITTVLTVFLSLIAGELTVRLVAPDLRLPYANYAFSSRYHHTGPELDETLNEIRTRPANSAEEFKVFVVGDSFVFGSGVSKNERFTSIIQTRLTEKYKNLFRIVNVGEASFSTIIYERMLRDVVRHVKPDLFIVALDQTDPVDDFIYVRDFSTPEKPSPGADFDTPFTNTILNELGKSGVRAYLYAHSRLFLLLNETVMRRLGHPFISSELDHKILERNNEKLRLYVETCRRPEETGRFFPRSLAYLLRMRDFAATNNVPILFVTYPRAEHIAGQPKTSLIKGAISDDDASEVYFEYWMERSGASAELTRRGSHVIHTSGAFRQASQRGEILYYSQNDVHWNAAGHLLFADLIQEQIEEFAIEKGIAHRREGGN